jgi:hypothetical protein
MLRGQSSRRQGVPAVQLPCFIGVYVSCVSEALRHFGPEALRPGAPPVRSFRFDFCVAHHLGPARGFGFDQRGKLLRRAAANFVALT